jgi:hypothetical protein
MPALLVSKSSLLFLFLCVIDFCKPFGFLRFPSLPYYLVCRICYKDFQKYLRSMLSRQRTECCVTSCIGNVTYSFLIILIISIPNVLVADCKFLNPNTKTVRHFTNPKSCFYPIIQTVILSHLDFL